MKTSDKWCNLDGKALAEAAFQEYTRINRVTSRRQRRLVLCYCMYDELSTQWGDQSPITNAVRNSSDYSAPVAYNELANATDSIVAELCQALSRPSAVVVGGSYEDASRAEDITSWLDWQFMSAGVDRHAAQYFRDGVIAGLGVCRVYEDGDEVKSERIWPVHLLVDDVSCVDVEPREFYVRRFMDRLAAVERYPDHAEAIESHVFPEDDSQWLEVNQSDETRDVVRVIECYRAPSGGKPGRYAAVLDSETVLDSYDLEDGHGLVFFRPVAATRGFWPRSMVDRAIPVQADLNKYLDRRSRAMHLHARPLIFLPRKAGVTKTHINNKLGSIIEYSGNQPPTYYTPPSMPPDVGQVIAEYSSKIYDAMGASEMAASAQVPRNLESGEAIANYVEMGSRRLVNVKRECDYARVGIAEAYIQTMRRIAEANPRAEVMFERWGAPARIPWREIQVPDKSLRLRIMPTGALGATEAIKMERLEAWLEKGWIDMETFVDAIDAHDVKAIGDYLTSPIALVRKMLEKMLRENVYIPPAEYMPLERAIGICERMLCQAQLVGADEGRLRALRDWWAHARELLGAAEMPEPAPPALPDPMAMGGPAGLPPGPAGPPMPPMDPGMVPMDPGMIPPNGGGPPMPPQM